MKTCLNSRDGLIVLEMDKLAYIQADGNYANLVYMCGDSVLVTLGLSKLEEVIRRAWPCEKVSPFVRMGAKPDYQPDVPIRGAHQYAEIGVVRQRRAQVHALGAQAGAQGLSREYL